MDKLEQVKGVGPYMISKLRNHGIWSMYDLLLHVPKSYENYGIIDLAKASHKEDVTVEGIIASELIISRHSKVVRVTFKLDIDKDSVDIIAFGKGYLVKTFKRGDSVVIKGIYHLFYHQINASSVLKTEKRVEMKPIYGLDPLHDRTISAVIQEIYHQNLDPIYEIIPEAFLTKYRLISRKEAYRLLHLPKTAEDVLNARRRMKYEEAFFLQLKWLKDRPNLIKRQPKTYDIHRVRALIDQIPYPLTSDQKQTVNDIFRDFKNDYASYRLIQGDVGSGKTIVALIAAYAVMTAGEQVAIMAPTELLANQHYQFFSSMIHDFKILRLTASTKRKSDHKLALERQDYDLVIGTHALIEADVQFQNLGLVIIDEQHKFGVTARQKLMDKAHSKDVLYLTATPIPRTLAMIAYGESHVSSIREKPKARQKIMTEVLSRDHIQPLIEHMRITLNRKEHIYVVVPAIHSEAIGDNIDSIDALLKENLDTKIYQLHGEQSKDDNEKNMEAFMLNRGSILLSTQMVEVGIDIPTATLIAIFSAERFGLAQLHQLRGRVGRSQLASYCYLVSKDEDQDRLNLLKKVDDGFTLSEYDLKSRGPGDFIGTEQSGFPVFKFLNLQQDYNILIEAQKNVLSLLEQQDFKTNPKYRYLNRHMNEDLKI